MSNPKNDVSAVRTILRWLALNDFYHVVEVNNGIESFDVTDHSVEYILENVMFTTYSDVVVFSNGRMTRFVYGNCPCEVACGRNSRKCRIHNGF